MCPIFVVGSVHNFGWYEDDIIYYEKSIFPLDVYLCQTGQKNLERTLIKNQSNTNTILYLGLLEPQVWRSKISEIWMEEIKVLK